jgi:hypothetical protein
VIGLLTTIVALFVCWVQTGVTLVINALVSALGTLLALLIAADPIDMPDPPALPAPFTTALGWVAWVFPVSTAVSILTFLIGAWLAWQVIAIGLRWAKAI